MQNLAKYRVKSGIITAIIFTLLFLIMLWIHFHTPIPPYPEGGGGTGMGLEVNLGTDETGLGEIDNMNISSKPEQQTQVSASKDEILTSKDDESEAIRQITDKQKKSTKRDPEKPKQDNKNKEESPKPVLNQKALFPAQTKNNEGNTNGKGNQGNENGVQGSPLYTGTGGGSGGGSGGGAGTGTGTDVGSGISFSLEGRAPSFLKKPPYKGQSEGKVVVEITVDKNGKVTSARPGVSGSTILDEDLLQVAKDAALHSTFSPKPDATVQKGRITYNFVLQ